MSTPNAAAVEGVERRGNSPAFPQLHKVDSEGWPVWGAGGMTLREYYAGLAMQGLIAKLPLLTDPQNHHFPQAVANGAVDYADALIAALESP